MQSIKHTTTEIISLKVESFLSLLFYNNNHMFRSHLLLSIFFIFVSQLLYSQILVINELDSDTPGFDNMEFLELKSESPNFPMDGYVVVFYNGSANGGNASYLAVDLDGYVTDINGIFLIGSEMVSPFPQIILPDNTIQNGADGVAIYRGDAEDFPLGTVAFVDDRLIDVLVYGTNDPDAVSMLDIFRAFYPNIKQINEGSTNNTNSIQRNNDGSYFTGNPTPRRPNDGSGVILNGLRAVFDKASYTEGETVRLTFTTETAVLENLNFEFSLNNGNFTNADYSGNTKMTITQGSTTVSTNILLIDDTDDEGDEDMVLRIEALPNQYLSLNNNVKIRVTDNDYKVADFGTPIDPTYGKVKGTQQSNYYDSLNGKSGTELKQAIQDIIADPNIVRAQTYNDVINILREADQNPKNSNQVWLVYLEIGRSKIDFQFNSDNAGLWNREHTWPRSRGGFNNGLGDDAFDGKDIFWITGPDSLRHANSDAHALRAADGPENSKRGNQFYGQYNGPSNTKGGFKGDVARGVFYLDVRYNGLDLVKGYPEGMVGKFGDLDTLLAWHRRDKADDFEMNRNNVVQSWQYNRNPFIDMPDLVEYIWGDKQGQTWQNPTSTSSSLLNNINVFPNPCNDAIYISGIKHNTNVQIFGIDGHMHQEKMVFEDTYIPLKLIPGHYFVRIVSNDNVETKSIVVY